MSKTSGPAASRPSNSHGQPIGKHLLFTDALEIACQQAGLVDVDGRPTVKPNGFPHTVGTQLAEGRAPIQTSTRPRLRDRLARERQLIQGATERGWPRDVERHTAVLARIHDLLTELGEPADSIVDEPAAGGQVARGEA